MKVIFKTLYYLVIALVFAIAILLFLPALPIAGNIETKVVLSGSMEPSIRVGSVIVLKPVDSYGVDDVITYGDDTNGNIPTTHRIIDVRIQNGEQRFQTKGDANPKPDNAEVRPNDIQGKVLFSIPFLGYLIDFAKKPMGFALLIIVPGSIIVLDELRKIVVEVIRMRKKKQRREVKSEEVE